MKAAIARIRHNDKRIAAALALPLALGVVAWPGVEAAAVMPAATPTFAQPQFADVIESVQPAVVKIAVVKNGAKVARLEGHPMQLDPNTDVTVLRPLPVATTPVSGPTKGRLTYHERSVATDPATACHLCRERGLLAPGNGAGICRRSRAAEVQRQECRR